MKTAQSREILLPQFLVCPESYETKNILTATPSAALICEGLQFTKKFFEKLQVAYSSKLVFKLFANFPETSTIIYEFARQIFGWNETAELYVYSAEFIAAKYLMLNDEQKKLLTVQITVDFLLNQFFPFCEIAERGR